MPSPKIAKDLRTKAGGNAISSASNALTPESNPITLHTVALTADQATRLKNLLQDGKWKMSPRPYTLYFAQKDKLTLAVYEKGFKCVIQGKGTEEFVRFILEPEILGEARLGYDDVHHPDWFEPHIGVDESGKGDFFGPLVIAGCYANGDAVQQMLDAGVCDSKRIGSDARIRELVGKMKRIPGLVVSVVVIGPQKYNELYKKFGNLNRLLAWGHARVIEDILERQPDCPRALSDQFANPAVIKRALMQRGRAIELQTRTKAESDPAVAGASILAREAFIDWMHRTGEEMGVVLPKGASALVKKTAVELREKYGSPVFFRLAKTHFKTAYEVAPDIFTSIKPEQKVLP